MGMIEVSDIKEGIQLLCGACSATLEPLNTDEHGNVISWSHKKNDCPWSEYEGLNKDQIMSIGLNAIINPFVSMTNEDIIKFARNLMENKVSFSELIPPFHQQPEDKQKG
ncbi:hypothetical protein [Aeromonas media]|uniref:hypothetical protein n=1 Tax=Aeromonas media TaxID=651 RepID=UPI003D1D052F